MDKRIEEIRSQMEGFWKRIRPMLVLIGLFGAGFIVAAAILLIANPYELDYNFEARRLLSTARAISPWEVPFERFSEQDFRTYTLALRQDEKAKCQKIASMRLRKTCLAYFIQRNSTVQSSLISYANSVGNATE